MKQPRVLQPPEPHSGHFGPFLCEGHGRHTVGKSTHGIHPRWGLLVVFLAASCGDGRSVPTPNTLISYALTGPGNFAETAELRTLAYGFIHPGQGELEAGFGDEVTYDAEGNSKAFALIQVDLTYDTTLAPIPGQVEIVDRPHSSRVPYRSRVSVTVCAQRSDEGACDLRANLGSTGGGAIAIDEAQCSPQGDPVVRGRFVNVPLIVISESNVVGRPTGIVGQQATLNGSFFFRNRPGGQFDASIQCKPTS